MEHQPQRAGHSPRERWRTARGHLPHLPHRGHQGAKQPKAPKPQHTLDSSELPRDTQDHWLDQVSEPEEDQHRSPLAWAYSSFAAPVWWARRGLSFAATTPGKLLTLGLILCVALIAAGTSMSQSAAQRQDNLNTLLTTTEPTSYAAHNLYSSLSLADTSATALIIRPEEQAEALTHSYEMAISDSSSAAFDVTIGLSEEDTEARQLIADIQRRLPTYTAVVERAQVQNRVGNPVAVSYMAEANALMRDELLPAASRLFDISSDKVSAEQNRLTRPQWIPLSGLVAAILFLVAAQFWLWRTTRRRFNKGFLAATAMMLLALLWVGASNAATWNAGTRGFERASTPWSSLTASRVLAQQSRTSETLAIVRRQSVAETDDSFNTTTHAVSEALDDAERTQHLSDTDEGPLTSARAALEDWTQGHKALVTALNEGNFSEAVRLSTETSYSSDADPTPAAAFNELDSALARLIADSRAQMRSFINDGLAATTLVAFSVMVLSIASTIAVLLGLRPRFQEYL